MRDAIILGGFGQHAALECRAKFHKRQAMIFLHQEAQAVGQFKFLDRRINVGFNGRGNFRRRAVRQQGVERAVFHREIFAGHTLYLDRRDALDGGKVAFGKGEVVRG